MNSIRRSLRRIDYYSASRDARRWPPGSAAALVIAALLAMPLTWYLGTNFPHTIEYDRKRGLLYQDLDGVINANLTEGQGGGNSILNPNSMQLGSFEFILESEGFGRPARTRTVEQPWQLNLDLFSEGAPRVDTRLDPNDPIAVALVDLLRNNQLGTIMVSVDNATVNDRHHLLAWCSNFIVNWIALLVFCLPAAALVHRLSLRAHNSRVRKRKRNQSTGKCLECGYDLRGLEFNERCPECGALAE